MPSDTAWARRHGRSICWTAGVPNAVQRVRAGDGRADGAQPGTPITLNAVPGDLPVAKEVIHAE